MNFRAWEIEDKVTIRIDASGLDYWDVPKENIPRLIDELSKWVPQPEPRNTLKEKLEHKISEIACTNGLRNEVYHMCAEIRCILEGDGEHEPRTTNLNFWEAYQAMKRGEWVATKLNPMVHHYAIGDRNEAIFAVRTDNEIAFASFTSYEYDNTEWCIVPKGPRYKIGDRFSTSTQLQPNSLLDVIIREVVYVDEATKTYAVNKEINMHHVGLEVITEDNLDHLHKIGSIPS